MQRVPTIDEIRSARAIVDRYLPRAPLERSPLLSKEFDAEIHLKIESFKPTRAFKARGALVKISSLDDAARRRGVVAASAGSHAQGVAFAAHVLGTPATVVMPRGVSDTIVGVCRAYGAAVLLEGDVFDEAREVAHRIERDENRTFIHPYADPLIIAGQGTIGLELLEELPDLEVIVVAVGGGGLSGGIALAVKSLRPEVRMVGVEPEGADAVQRSVQVGAPVVLEHPRSVADKLVARTTERVAIDIGRRYIDQYVTVSEKSLEDATYDYLERLSLLVEPSGAAPLAAIRERKVDVQGRRTVLIVSGGNVAPDLLSRIITERTMAPGELPQRGPIRA